MRTNRESKLGPPWTLTNYLLRTIATGLVFIGTGFSSGAVRADADLFARPSVTIAKVHDDNLFFASSQPQQDHFLRVTPAIEAGYRSVPMTLTGRFAFDAERYAEHSELDNNRARENAALGFRYQPTRALTLFADASRLKTQSPGELTPETGVQIERASAERLSVSPSALYRFDRLTIGTATYRFIHDEVVGGIGSDTQSVELGLDRRVARRDTASFRYRFEHFHFDTGDPVDSHTLLGGGTHEFTPRTLATVLVGPRFSDGSIDPEVSASLEHKLERGEVSLGYTRSETTVLGLAGTATTDAVTVTFVHSIGPSLEVRAAPSYVSSKLGGLRTDVFIMNLDAGYRISRYLTLSGSYQFVSQRGSLETPGSGDVTRNLISLGLTIAAPERTSSRSRPSVLPAPPLSEAPARRPTTGLRPGEEPTGLGPGEEQ